MSRTIGLSRGLWVVVVSIGVFAAGCTTLAGNSSEFREAREQRRAFGDKLMDQALADTNSHPLVYAMLHMQVYQRWGNPQCVDSK